MAQKLSMDRDAIESMQHSLNRTEPGIFAGYAMIGAIGLFGGAGFLADHYLGTKPWLLLAGLLVGLALGFYQLARVLKR